MFHVEQWESRQKVPLGMIGKLGDVPRGTVSKWRKYYARNKEKVEENVPRGTMEVQMKGSAWNNQ